MRIAASAIRTHRRRTGLARQSSAARRRPSRLPATAIATVTNTWSYNRRRLPTAETQTPDGTRSWSLTYGYNAQGQRTSETAPDNVTTTYTVNALGQTTQISVKVKNATTTVASNASYYPNGALQQFTYGNGITHTLTQNARQLPQRSQDGSVLDLTTTFDANGNVASIVDGTANARQSRSMAYDGLDRLTQVQSPMFGTASYGYDEQDNLRHVTVSGGSQPRDHTYCYGADNRLEFVRSGPNCTGNASPAVIALGYDVQGNLQYRNGTAYSFDYGNRLRNTANQSYRYDAAGRRVRTDSAGSQLQYSDYASDGRLVWQRDEAVGKRINNIYLAGSLVAEVSRSLTTDATTYRYIHTDALGSPIAKTSSTGAVVETSEYEPYGQLLNRANDDRVGYTGHVMDSASGLTYMQQRYFDPQLGIFDSVDPVTAYSSGNWRQFNRYAYAFNNPFAFIDPDGRQAAGSDQRNCADGSCERPDLPENIPDPPKGCGITRDCIFYGDKWHSSAPSGNRSPQVAYINDGPIESVAPELYLIGGWEIAGYKSLVALRGAYLSGVEGLVAQGGRMAANGRSAEEIARVLVPLRNALKDQIRRAGPITARMAAEFRNFLKYGNRLGPSAEQQFARYGSWDRVVEKVGETNATVNKVAGQ